MANGFDRIRKGYEESKRSGQWTPGFKQRPPMSQAETKREIEKQKKKNAELRRRRTGK